MSKSQDVLTSRNCGIFGVNVYLRVLDHALRGSSVDCKPGLTFVS